MVRNARKELSDMKHNLDFKLASRKEIVDKIEEAISNPPDEYPVNILLTGNAANKFNLLKIIISSSYPNLDEEDILKYIIRAGIEREFEKFSEVLK